MVNLNEIKNAVLSGFILPVLSLVDSAITYAFSQIITITAATFAINIGIAIAVTLGFLKFEGYFKDFANSLKSIIFTSTRTVGAVVGLIFFWSAMLNINNGIGVDAVTSSIVTIVVMIIAIFLAILSKIGAI